MSCARFTTDNLRTAFDFVLQFCCHRVSALHFKADILLILLVSFPFSVFNRQWAAVQSVRSILVCRSVWRRPWLGSRPCLPRPAQGRSRDHDSAEAARGDQQVPSRIFHWLLRPACVPMPENVLWSAIPLRPLKAKPLAVAGRSLNCSWAQMYAAPLSLFVAGSWRRLAGVLRKHSRCRVTFNVMSVPCEVSLQTVFDVRRRGKLMILVRIDHQLRFAPQRF